MPKGHLNQLYRGTIVYRIRISKKERERNISISFQRSATFGYHRCRSATRESSRSVGENKCKFIVRAMDAQLL